MILRLNSTIFWSALLLAVTASPEIFAAQSDAPVAVNDDALSATLDNGIVAATIKKSNGNLLSLRFRGIELMSRGGGYWNIYGKTPGEKNTQEKGAPSVFRVSRDPAKNGGSLGEISIRCPYTPQPGSAAKTVPLNIEIRYTLRRGDCGIYGWTIAEHEPHDPAFNIEVSTVCLKLNPDVFDFLSVDSRRQRHMPTPEDWVRGEKLNLLEARRMTTGIHAGEVEHKYDYNVLFSQTPAWGWSSTKRHVGLFVVNPSIEYINGGPVMVDYVGHLDGKPSLPADPTLLFIWHSPHYGGRAIVIGADERWQKIVGPFLFYCNAAGSPEEMWRDALARAAREQKAWPYDWAEHGGYEHRAQRGSVQGKLVVADPQAPAANAAGAWVGLAAAPYLADAGKNGSPITVDWQTDGKHYQYWTRADQSGNFTIANARPGEYTLNAFTDGILGDFSSGPVSVGEGKTTMLGELKWAPVRYGKQLWVIGVPNRSAEEFRHGDHYWQWGLYNLYPQEFPSGVDFLVGTSDWKRDWNYAQPPLPNGHGGWTNSTWKIRFALDHKPTGTATLRLSICGARGGPLDVAVNGTSIGGTGELPESGVMHRDGIRASALVERNLKFDAAILKMGMNTMTLTKHARTWTDGVLYDYLRLEVDSARPFSP